MNGDAKYLALLDEMRELHLRKNADYGRSNDPFANVRASEQIGIPAWKAAWLRAKEKVHRVDTFCLKGMLVNESAEDSLKDLAAYALITLRLLRETIQQDEKGRWEVKSDDDPKKDTPLRGADDDRSFAEMTTV